MNPIRGDIERLRRMRPRSRFVRLSLFGMAALIAVSWAFGDFLSGDAFSARRLANAARFLGELLPYPLQAGGFEWAVAVDWAADLMRSRGWQALLTTLAISVAAIVLAALLSALLTLPATRSIAAAEPFVLGGAAPPTPAARAWRTLVGATRLLLILLRSIPEYVWAFLLLALFGPTAWPAVLALALHNTGILGRLSADVIENLPAAPLRALRAGGATRLQIAACGVLPVALPRFLSFFFYRWETCVREATVLGILGIVSLGYWIQDARARNFYDEMFFFVLLGAVLVLLGDLVSALARRAVRPGGHGGPVLLPRGRPGTVSGPHWPRP